MSEFNENIRKILKYNLTIEKRVAELESFFISHINKMNKESIDFIKQSVKSIEKDIVEDQEKPENISKHEFYNELLRRISNVYNQTDLLDSQNK